MGWLRDALAFLRPGPPVEVDLQAYIYPNFSTLSPAERLARITRARQVAAEMDAQHARWRQEAQAQRDATAAIEAKWAADLHAKKPVGLQPNIAPTPDSSAARRV